MKENKSLKKSEVDPKKTPRKFTKKQDADKSEKIENSFYLLKPKEKLLANKMKIHEAVLNSKLIEPLIEEKLKKNNKSDFMSGTNSVQSAHILNGISSLISSNILNDLVPNSERLPMRPLKTESKIRGLSDKKQLSSNIKKYSQDSGCSKEKIQQSEFSSKLLSKSSIFQTSEEKSSIRGDCSSNNSLINMFLRSQAQSQTQNNTSNQNNTPKRSERSNITTVSNLFSKSKKKVKLTKRSKRKPEDMTLSDEERLNVTSKKKINRY